MANKNIAKSGSDSALFYRRLNLTTDVIGASSEGADGETVLKDIHTIY